MGIRPGKIIFKINEMFSRGPVTVRIDSNDIVLDSGSAGKIIVEVDV